jgi:hypothetical protein
LLFLTPFVAFVAWRLSLGGGGPPRLLLIGTACVLALLGGVLFWLSRERMARPGTVYVPAALLDGRVVAGHAAAPDRTAVPAGATPPADAAAH